MHMRPPLVGPLAQRLKRRGARTVEQLSSLLLARFHSGGNASDLDEVVELHWNARDWWRATNGVLS